MNEEDRDAIIKEARINSVRDVFMALARMDAEIRDEDVKKAGRLFRHYLNQRLSEIGDGTADRVRVTHRVWEDAPE